MKKKTYFYFNCDTVRGQIVLGVEVDGHTFGNLIDAEADLKSILEPTESVRSQCVRRPRGLDWETFRNKPWCVVGFKQEKES